MSVIHHIGCLVADMNEAVSDYKILHPGGTISQLFHIADQNVYVQFFKFDNIHIEFVQPIDLSSTLGRMLKKTPGYYHIGIYTADIESEIARLEAEDYKLISKFSSEAFQGKFCAFLYNQHMHLVELIEQ